MSNAIVNYVVYTGGNRKNRTGATATLLSPQTNIFNDGGEWKPPVFDTLKLANSEYSLSFVAVSGQKSGASLYKKDEIKDSSITVEVGDADVNVLAVYFPVGFGTGESGGGTGVVVDAFNLDTLSFSNSDFVDVLINNQVNKAATDMANIWGSVSSAQAEDIRAYEQIDGLYFTEWLKDSVTEFPKNDYMMAKGESGVVFAYYHSKKSVGGTINGHYAAEWTNISKGVAVGAGGHGILGGHVHPIDPNNPLFEKLRTGVVTKETRGRG